jgi:uncharacterized protein YbjT (DUF2867 family)
MVASLLTDAADDRHVPLGGPEALVGDEVAERLSEGLGKPVRFQSLDPNEFASRMSMLVTGSATIAPHSIYHGMAAFYSWYNAQPTSPLTVDPAVAADLLGVRGTPYVDWVRSKDWMAGL